MSCIKQKYYGIVLFGHWGGVHPKVTSSISAQRQCSPSKQLTAGTTTYPHSSQPSSLFFKVGGDSKLYCTLMSGIPFCSSQIAFFLRGHESSPQELSLTGTLNTKIINSGEPISPLRPGTLHTHYCILREVSPLAGTELAFAH